MKTLQCTVLFLAFSVATRASADTCSPNFTEWGWEAADVTQDGEITTWWCNTPTTQSTIDGYWAALDLGITGQWTEYANLDLATCNPNGYFSRLINSAVMMSTVADCLSNSPVYKGNVVRWMADQTSPLADDGFRATCENGDAIAGNPANNDAIKLHYKFFWKRGAVGRGSTLLHEAVHEVIGHEANGTCPADKSCDSDFGPVNAQTFQIRYLADAISAYRVAGPNELVVVNKGNGRCGYLPLLSWYERVTSADLAQDKLETSFQTSPVPKSSWPAGVKRFLSGIVDGFEIYDFAIDSHQQAEWSCAQVCNPEDFTTGALACPTQWNAANTAINQQNATICDLANQEVQAGVTPAQHGTAVSSFKSNLKACAVGVSQVAVNQHCAALQATASTVGDIKTGWAVPNQPGAVDSPSARFACIKSYCESHADTQWYPSAQQACFEWSDPFGCMDYVCGSLSDVAAKSGASSQDYFETVQCRAQHLKVTGPDLTVKGSLGYGADATHADKCQNQFDACSGSAGTAEAAALQKYNQWLQADAAGECYFTPTTSYLDALGKGFINVDSVATDMGQLSLAEFNQKYGVFEATACLVEVFFCRAVEDSVAETLGRFVEVRAGIPDIAGPVTNPENPVFQRHTSPLYGNVRLLAGILTDTSGTRREFTRAEAIQRLSRDPQAKNALADLVSHHVYFALTGTRGMAPIFGHQRLARHGSTSTIHRPEALTREQESAFQGLDAARTSRLRIESAETQALLGRAVDVLTPSELHAIIQDVADGATMGEMETMLDVLQVRVER